MPLFFITGISGSGKSEVLKELRSRGYEAYGSDEDAMAHWHNNETGYVHPKSSIKTEMRTAEFMKNNTWKISRTMVEDLAAKTKHKAIFLCGVAAGDNELWDLFDKVYSLAIDMDTLKYRIEARTENDFGKALHELDYILEMYDKPAPYAKLSHVKVDATQPVAKVVDGILADIGTELQ